jgi:multidrug efflux pump subunit AcrB
VTLTSPDSSYDDLFLCNYATLHIKDELSRLDGVGNVLVFGTGNYSMRVWLDPARLKARGLTTNDVVAAIQEQNVQVQRARSACPPSPMTRPSITPSTSWGAYRMWPSSKTSSSRLARTEV